MILPKKLKQGSRIGFVSPSGYRLKEKFYLVDAAIEKLNELGYEVVWGEHVRAVDRYGVSAGTIEERVADIHRFFSDDSIDALWCTGGGNTANELLDHLDYDLIRAHPKLFIGLSDNSVLLNAIMKHTGLITIHGTDPKLGSGYFDDEYTHRELVTRLERGEIGTISESAPRETVRSGRGEGILVGGNLSCLLKTAGTGFFPDTDRAILLLESYLTDLRGILARLAQLRQMGVFDRIAGMVLGDFHAFDQEEQKDINGNRIRIEELLLVASEGYDFPILKIREAGHKCPSTFLPIGGRVQIDADAQTLEITEPFLI